MVLQRGKRRLLWLALVVIALGAALLAAAIWGLPGRSRGKQELAAEFVANGQASLEQGDVRSAWEQSAEAAELDASRPDYAGCAVQWQPRLMPKRPRQGPDRAWQAGLRDAEVLPPTRPVRLTLEPPPVTSDTLLAMCRELPAGLGRDALQAEILDLSGRPREAIAVWTGVLQERATAEWVEQLAQAYVQAGEPRAALEFLAAPARQELLNEASYSLPLNLQAGQHDWAQVRDTCRLAQQTGHYAGPCNWDYALLLAVDGEDDQAVLVLRPLADQTQSTAGPYPLHARLLLSYLHLRTGDRAAIGALLERGAVRARTVGTRPSSSFTRDCWPCWTAMCRPRSSRLRNALRCRSISVRVVAPDQPIVEWTLGCCTSPIKASTPRASIFRPLPVYGLPRCPRAGLLRRPWGRTTSRRGPGGCWMNCTCRPARPALCVAEFAGATAGRAAAGGGAELGAARAATDGPPSGRLPSDAFSLEISAATPIFRSSQNPTRTRPNCKFGPRIAHWIDQQRSYPKHALLAARSSQAPPAERQRWIASALWRLDRTDEAASAFEAAVQQTQRRGRACRIRRPVERGRTR